MLKAGANVLLLDEPTNDLDVDTLRALEEALLDFAGCAVVITHDRWFLDRIATHILAFEGDSQVVWFEGNYADYEADRRRRLGADADQPHRIRYKPLCGAANERAQWQAPAEAPGQCWAPARCGLLPQRPDQALHLAAVTLDDRGEFLALGHRHADPVDNDVADLVAAVVRGQPPIDLGRLGGAVGRMISARDR